MYVSMMGVYKPWVVHGIMLSQVSGHLATMISGEDSEMNNLSILFDRPRCHPI